MGGMAATPMMKQYQEAKRACPDALLLFRMGDFYEMFHDDAKTAARVLNLALTSRDKGEDATPMAGFPLPPVGVLPGQADLRRLPRGGLRAGRRPEAGQGTGPPGGDAGGHAGHASPTTPCWTRARATTWRRSARATRSASPGWRSRRAASRRPGFRRASWPTSWPGFAPGRVSAGGATRPAAGPALDEQMMVTRRPGLGLRRQTARQTLTKHFGTASLEGFGFTAGTDDAQAIQAAGAILDYLGETQKSSLDHIDRLVPYRARGHAGDRRGQPAQPGDRPHDPRRPPRRLAALACSSGRITAMGSRLLADWVANPLTDAAAINHRLDAVEELLGDPSLAADLREIAPPGVRRRAAAGPRDHRPGQPARPGLPGPHARSLPAMKAKLTARKSRC